MGRRAFGLASAVLAASLLSQPAFASPTQNEFNYLSKPSVTKLLSPSLVEAKDWIQLSGTGLNRVTEVFVDSNSAEFELVSGSEIRIRIPDGVSPGDAVLRISGDFGLLSYQNLFEVMPASKIIESKITIGTFQGYAAVYTKNFKGKELRIVIGDRTRVIPTLAANYTQNLTKVGAGNAVRISVYLDSDLLKSQELSIK